MELIILNLVLLSLVKGFEKKLYYDLFVYMENILNKLMICFLEIVILMIYESIVKFLLEKGVDVNL